MTSSPRRRPSSCPRPSRRGLLTAGLAGLGGLSLVDLLRADATPAAVRRSVIHVHLDGGPPQMDTIDMKPDGPAEVRGEFSAIATAVPGIHVCELLPGLARLAGRFAFLRAVVGSAGQHDAFQCQSGYDPEHLKSQGGWPAIGSVLSKLHGRPGDTAPLFVVLLGWWLLRETPRRLDWVVLAVVFGGLALFFVGKLGLGGAAGNLLGLASGFLFGCFFVFKLAMFC